MYAERKVGDFVEALASRSSVPGGGTASAGVAAIGAALGVMAMRFSGKPASDDTGADEESGRSIPTLVDIQEKLIMLMDEDADAYGKVKSAYSMPKEDQEKRRAAIQAALHGAAEVPLKTMELSLKGMVILQTFLPLCKQNLLSDCKGGIIFLHAGLRGCAENVGVNCAGIKNGETANSLMSACEEIMARAADIASSCEQRR